MGTWREDAREFSLHYRQGGWRLGLLVARNVARGADIARRQNKVLAQAFAEEAKLTPATILLYYDAWERAADTGVVPHAWRLTPGSEPQLNLAMLPDWRTFYRSERDLRGRSGSVELHPSRDVMRQRLEKRPEITDAVIEALPASQAAAVHEKLAERIEQEHIPAPSVPVQRPVYQTVGTVQAVLDDIERLIENVDKLPPVMTTHSKDLLSQAGMKVEPTVKWLIELAEVPLGDAV